MSDNDLIIGKYKNFNIYKELPNGWIINDDLSILFGTKFITNNESKFFGLYKNGLLMQNHEFLLEENCLI